MANRFIKRASQTNIFVVDSYIKKYVDKLLIQVNDLSSKIEQIPRYIQLQTIDKWDYKKQKNYSEKVEIDLLDNPSALRRKDLNIPPEEIKQYLKDSKLLKFYKENFDLYQAKLHYIYDIYFILKEKLLFQITNEDNAITVLLKFNNDVFYEVKTHHTKAMLADCIAYLIGTNYKHILSDELISKRQQYISAAREDKSSVKDIVEWTDYITVSVIDYILLDPDSKISKHLEHLKNLGKKI